MQEEMKKSLEQRIANMQSELDEIKKLLEETKCENASFNYRLLSEVVQKGDEVLLYGKIWYVIDIEDGIVKLINKEFAGKISKSSVEKAEKFCGRLHKYSQEYVEELSKDKNLLHTEVRSCTKEDLDKYLNRKVVDGVDCMTDSVWNVHCAYWLASPHPYNSGTVWYVYSDGCVFILSYNTFGVRPVVYLKSDIRTFGKDGIWILE